MCDLVNDFLLNLYLCFSDIYTVDEELTSTLQVYLLVLFEVVSTVVVISCVTPFFTVCLIPIILYYLWEQSYFTVGLGLLRYILPGLHSIVSAGSVSRVEKAGLRESQSDLCLVGRVGRRGCCHTVFWCRAIVDETAYENAGRSAARLFLDLRRTILASGTA